MCKPYDPHRLFENELPIDLEFLGFPSKDFVMLAMFLMRSILHFFNVSNLTCEYCLRVFYLSLRLPTSNIMIGEKQK